MTIYFNASVSGKKDYENNYRSIIESLQNMGHEVIYEHIFDVDPTELVTQTPKERASHHKNLNKWLSKADAVIVEVSYPSVSVGYEIGLALDKNKPVLALYSTENPPAALAGENSEKFILAKYDRDNLQRDLKYLINDFADLQDTRFNFFISPKHQNYLDWIAKNRKIPRSVFLRDLIEEHMEENEEYNG